MCLAGADADPGTREGSEGLAWSESNGTAAKERG